MKILFLYSAGTGIGKLGYYDFDKNLCNRQKESKYILHLNVERNPLNASTSETFRARDLKFMYVILFTEIDNYFCFIVID